MELPQPQAEHLWLHKLVGEWRFEHDCSPAPDQPAEKLTGTETVRSLGGLWTIGDIDGTMPDGGSSRSVMTLGYDPAKKKFVGSFIASVMTHFWPYEGSLNPTTNTLTLDSEGPSFADQTKMTKYQDIITFIDDNHRTLSSQYLDDQGQWQPFMTAHYYRK